MCSHRHDVDVDQAPKLAKDADAEDTTLEEGTPRRLPSSKVHQEPGARRGPAGNMEGQDSPGASFCLFFKKGDSTTQKKLGQRLLSRGVRTIGRRAPFLA